MLYDFLFCNFMCVQVDESGQLDVGAVLFVFSFRIIVQFILLQVRALRPGSKLLCPQTSSLPGQLISCVSLACSLAPLSPSPPPQA